MLQYILCSLKFFVLTVQREKKKLRAWARGQPAKWCSIHTGVSKQGYKISLQYKENALGCNHSLKSAILESKPAKHTSLFENCTYDGFLMKTGLFTIYSVQGSVATSTKTWTAKLLFNLEVPFFLLFWCYVSELFVVHVLLTLFFTMLQ